MDEPHYEFTSDEVLEVLDEMGLQLDSQEEVDRLLRAVVELDMSSANDSVFLHDDVEDESFFRNSIQRLPHRRPDAQYTDQFLPEPRPRLDVERLLITGEPDVDYLIATAYDMIGRLYETSSEIDAYLKSQYRAGDRLQTNQATIRKDSNAQNIRPRCLTRSRSFDDRFKAQPPKTRQIHRICSIPTTSQQESIEKNVAEEVNNKENEPLRAAKDLGLRSVLHPLPGRLAYKNDPVRKMEMVREEWQRNPPVNEKKRLKLRWAVRDYMLRQSEPSYDPRRLPRPVIHPKDWSPRPYLP